ncbi:hypothetical protein JVT61DRAFT_13303 [Boletus reticuloceps]|uniref:RRM domain-containing protein n=1 Tax=Boletus reticuloceps TaxID=495285 RepID=A0A8I2YYV8_9AGAM|nr:hypothetical protein JVT61DRAFT_13303 [Boletus reticuloceps]
MSFSFSSPESSSSPAPTRKKRQVEVESSDSSDHDTPDAEEDSNTPQSIPPTEATVLSHAEQRRQKKRQKLNQAALTSESASPRKKRKLDDGSPSSVHVDVNANANANAKAATKTKSTPATDDHRRQKHQNSIWVGNLSFWTTQDALRGFFDGVGTITRVHMPMRRGKQTQDENMGFAYVDFETPDAKIIAIALSEGQLDSRNLLIKDGDDFTGRPVKSKTERSEETGHGEGGKVTKIATTAQGKGLSKTAQKILRAQKQPPAPTLFLGNLGFETTEESIRELFEAHRYWGHKDKDKGKGVDIKAEGQEESQGGDAAKSKDVWIRKIRMGTFEDSGTCKGFAFVDFTSIEHATEALVNPRNHRLNGRDLVVEYASPDAVRRGGGPRHPKGEQDQKSRSGSGKAPQKDSVNTPYSKQRKPQRHTKQGDGEDAEAAEIPAETTTPRHDWSHTRRTKPGAALAHALRQSAAILPGQGQKIVF